MAHLYPSYLNFGDDMNFHHHQQSKGFINNNNNNNTYYNGKLGNLDESDNMVHAEDQKWNMAAARLAMSANMRAKFDNKSNDSNNASHASINGGGRVMASSLNNSDNNKSSKNISSNSSNRPNSSGGKNKHKANSTSNHNSAQNEIVNSMINKILNMDMKQHNHHQALDSYVPASQKGILSHETTGSKPSGNMMTSQSSQQGNSNSQRANPNSPNNSTPVVDKRFKTLPASESLPRNETLGGYIFVCNNDTMQEDLKRQLFGLPQRYRDSVRTIQPGLPLFLYNYTTHQLHGIFEAASFGGSNIDPTAWEDKKNKGESRFPAQVRIRVRRMCKPLEEDAFRPVLFHYDGPKFRLQLSVPETLAIMDLLSQNGSV